MININNEECKSDISHSRKLSICEQREGDVENMRLSSVPPTIKVNAYPDMCSEVVSSKVNIHP